MRFLSSRTDEKPIVVPDKIRNRARKALKMGHPGIWVDQTLFLVGQNFSGHTKGDGQLDEAIDSAYALLALLVEYRDMEESSL